MLSKTRRKIQKKWKCASGKLIILQMALVQRFGGFLKDAFQDTRRTLRLAQLWLLSEKLPKLINHPITGGTKKKTRGKTVSL